MLQRSRLPGITGLALFLLLAGCAEPTRDVSPWSRLLPSEAGQSVVAMALDPQGEPAVTGTLLDENDPSFIPPFVLSKGAFVTMLSDTGKDIWGGTNRGWNAQGSGVAIAPNGDVLLLSTNNLFEGSPDSPFVRTLLSRFDPRGKLLWSKPVGNGEAQKTEVGLSLATNASGEPIVGGYIRGPIEIRDDIIVEAQSGFISSYDADGNRRWSQTFEGQVGEITALTVDASGAVFAAGHDLGILDYAPPEPVATVPSAFITKLTSYGQPIFTTRLNGVLFQTAPRITAMALSSSGVVVFSGSFGNDLSFGPLLFHANAGSESFVAKLSGATGEPHWLAPIQTTFGRSDVLAIAVAPDDRIYATGQYAGDELTLAGLTFGPTGGTAMFLAELDAQGKATDGRIFDHAGKLSVGRALAVDPAGALVLAGHFVGQIELDDQTLTSAPFGSSFVARLALPFASHRRE